ncbi:MAG: tetratricopeptide repeat protein, partial [Spirochaetota bacterium]
ALAYIQNNKTDKAILLLERNIKDDPNYYKSCLLLGKLYANSNNRDKALEVLSVFTSGETDSESIQNDDPAFSQYRKDAKEIINRIK